MTVSEGSPWKDYHAFLEVDLLGPALISHKQNSSFDRAMVKRVQQPVDIDFIRTLQRPAHKNILDILEVYVDDLTVYIAYECMTISLDAIRSSPVALEEPHVAAICCEVSFSPYVIYPF